MKLRFALLIPFASLLYSPLQAQLPDEGSALAIAEYNPIGSIGIQFEDMDRVLKDGDTRASLDMTRVTVAAQTQVIPGVIPWIEAGWHDPELLAGKSNGGFTWGLGTRIRPWLYPLRSDPTLGPRDWIAINIDLAYRAGQANADNNSEIEWASIEGAFGLEWHQKYIGRNNGPMGTTDITAGASILLNQTDGKQDTFDGSAVQNIGFRFMTGFTIGSNSFLTFEADFFGSSDRRLSLSSGFKF